MRLGFADAKHDGETMKRLSRFAMLVMALSLLIVMIAPASAITDGELAGDDHPEVVLVVMEVGGQPAIRCSGTPNQRAISST